MVCGEDDVAIIDGRVSGRVNMSVSWRLRRKC